MSASPDTDQPPADGAKKRGLPAFVPVVLAIVGGIAAGGAAGAFFVGPALAEGIAPKSAATATKGGEHGEDGDSAASEDGAEAAAEGGHGGKEGEGATAKPVYTIDNLVLNPAQSGGTRFLLLTVAFELKDEATLEELKTRDAELRDAVLVTVGAKSVEFLSDMAVRDTLKNELRGVTAKLFPKKKNAIRRIYFPQFVIQ
jgi:flagellar FliL protein